MFIYVHYEADQPNGLAFHKAEKAVEYVIEKIEENIGVKKKAPSVRKTKQPKVDCAFLQQLNPVNQIRLAPIARPPAEEAPDGIENAFLGINQPALSFADYETTMKKLVKKLDSKQEDPKLLVLVQEQIAITTANKTIENAKKLIEQYDIYMKETFNVHCPLHTIQEIGIVDAKV